ncbi:MULTISPECIES: Fe(3+)-siderophore ABC transporter permease [Chromobacterium]|uniref:Fe(3+)-siderophore ABC transporter permease n=1 Tax=Chromobacterium TaxID=535 RepID=UPI000D30A3D2|nr:MULTISPECIES: Fe(3+)-siderophore ABC transporter permease [Chromobacterium]PTU67948.1 Fe(3+)-siderophore ABC transporter permease [Chromobacterium sp. Panama]UJB32835.1 Fe(3+)-siderophore ABC transporter permease [Chromobacterium sp. Beijing]
MSIRPASALLAPTAPPSRRLTLLLCCLAALAAIALLSLMLGAKSIPASVVWRSLLHGGGDPDSVIVLQGRLPRTLLGLLAGAALGLSGALIQALSRNPLADPGVLGVNAGASFAMVLGVAAWGVDSQLGYLGCAAAGALGATLLVYAVGARGRRMDPLRFVLAGVAVSAVLMGLSTAITLLDPLAFNQLRYWNAGTLDVRSMTPVALVAPVIAAGGLLALLLARPLNTLGMGSDLAVSLGGRPLLIQAGAVLAITLLCGASTAVAGPIAFIGLMIPHLARWLGGADLRWTLPFTLLLAPILLLSSDIVGRLLTPGELRVSIVTAFIGAPALIWLARRHAAPGGRS